MSLKLALQVLEKTIMIVAFWDEQFGSFIEDDWLFCGFDR
jgi:hypothetical protein